MADHQDKSAKSAQPVAGHAADASSSVEQLAEKALDSARRAAQTIAAQTDVAGEKINLPSFTGQGTGSDRNTIAMLDDVLLHVKVELGRTRMYVEDVLRLAADSVVELDKAAGDPVDIYVNDRHVARGEVLVVNENFCVRVSEILAPVTPVAPA